MPAVAFFSYICVMLSLIHLVLRGSFGCILHVDRHFYACIKQHFRVFCNKLYYFSNFKDFNTFTLAC